MSNTTAAAATSTLPPPPAMPAVLKTCACGLSHTAEDWLSLEYVGRWDLEPECFELRNCVCRSTLAIEVES